ncbi:hypothetical protein AVEN_41793-1 [Araneus ventricosus]|uniref:Uncharacterized protein n=1 Tax=Araneus ventricosus TaxID=182803 RepID=A0A4Y2AC82_ARAVE|nr:hypothetical protein AVEN_41793-1 [Araneus ventricosus]
MAFQLHYTPGSQPSPKDQNLGFDTAYLPWEGGKEPTPTRSTRKGVRPLAGRCLGNVTGSRGGLVVRCRYRSCRIPGSKLDSTEDPSGPFHVKSYVGTKRHPAGVVRKFGEGVPAQVSFSSSDQGSKLRGPSQNSTRVASRWVVNITKLTAMVETISAPASSFQE